MVTLETREIVISTEVVDNPLREYANQVYPLGIVSTILVGATKGETLVFDILAEDFSNGIDPKFQKLWQLEAQLQHEHSDIKTTPVSPSNLEALRSKYRDRGIQLREIPINHQPE